MPVRGLIRALLERLGNRNRETPATNASGDERPRTATHHRADDRRPPPASRLGLADAPAPGTMIDAAVLAEKIRTLRGLLEQIDDLSERLPDDARPLGLAARRLVEESLRACEAPRVDAGRLVADMQQVSALAAAMRERLLFNPHSRRPRLPN